MPGEQADLVDHLSAPFTMVRLLLRPGTRYQQQRETMAPFNRIVQQDEHMRRDTSDVLRRAVAAGQTAYLLVNNKAEGSSGTSFGDDGHLQMSVYFDDPADEATAQKLVMHGIRRALHALVRPRLLTITPRHAPRTNDGSVE